MEGIRTHKEITESKKYAERYTDRNNDKSLYSVYLNKKDDTLSGASGGNGYDGYSMSNNARMAYENGEMPLSKWSKSEIISAVADIDSSKAEMLKKVNLQTLKKNILSKSSWHHTSLMYNKTDFYSIDEDAVEDLTEAQIKKWATTSETKSNGKEYRGDIDHIEWSGTRNHLKAIKHTLNDVNIEERGSFYIVTDDNGKELIRKKISSNGTYVTNYEVRDRINKEVAEAAQRIKDNSSPEAYELYKTYNSVSSSGHRYAEGRKPSRFDYDNITAFFNVGEKRLAINDNGGYDVEVWNGNSWDKSVKYSKKNAENINRRRVD